MRVKEGFECRQAKSQKIVKPNVLCTLHKPGRYKLAGTGWREGLGGGVNWVFEYEYNYGVIFFYESSGVYRSVKEYNYCEILFLYESCLCVHTSVREYIV